MASPVADSYSVASGETIYGGRSLEGDVVWAFDDDSTIFTHPGFSNVLAVNVPDGATVYSSPDLLPGQTLEIAENILSLISDSTVPTNVDGTDVGSPFDEISSRDHIIEVLDNPQAVAQNMRTGEMFGAGYTGSYRNIQYANTRSQDGDTIQISPGAIFIPGNGDGSSYLEGGALHLTHSMTVTGIPGRGRWTCGPPDVDTIGVYYSGIVIHEPGQTWAGMDETGYQVNPRKTIVISDFDFRNWGTDSGAKGVRIREDTEIVSSYDYLHESVTLRNFFIGKPAGQHSGSGVGGSCETLIMEDGAIGNCGDGNGQEHNVYASARYMTLKGCRFFRSAGWPGTPQVGYPGYDGHLLKIVAVTGTIEGCSIDAVYTGDHSKLVQFKAGGNWIVRGCLLQDSAWPSNANGMVMFTREGAGFSPNYDWWAGDEGNSLLFEKNVVIGHYPRGVMHFLDPTVDANTAFQSLFPESDGTKPLNRRLQSLVIRDNIGMIRGDPEAGLPDGWMIGMVVGFPGTDNEKWIQNDPNGGATWNVRGNTTLTYDINEGAFSDKLLKIYTRTAGTIAADAGTVAGYRFIWPHGSMARSDAFRGLG